MYIATIIAIHVLLLWKVYINPYHMATGELISTFFPSWIWMGRQARKLHSWKYDSYWLNYHAHPVLSSYYPPHVLTAWISSFLNLNASFKLFVYTIYLHMLVQSILWYYLLLPLGALLALFGSITITYAAFQWRTQPCIIYTLTWFPLSLYANHFLAGSGLCLMLLGGYFPIAIYLVPLIIVKHALSWQLFYILGIIPALIQIVPFVRYLLKTIRHGTSSDLAVGFWEKRWWFGLTPLLFIPIKFYAIVLLYALIVSAYKQVLPRVWQRAMIPMYYLAILTALINIPTKYINILIALQVLDLWLHNRSMIPTRPFCELWSKPSNVFNTPLTRFLEKQDGRISGLPFPLWTGHINNLKTLGYCGGMANKMMAKFRNDNNPNGSGTHDWFKTNKDGKNVDLYGIKYAYTRKKMDWKTTGIRYLWENPRFS